MKKGFMILLSISCIFLSMIIVQADFWSSDSNIIVSIDSDKMLKGTFIDDRIYVPVREVSELLNIPIKWNVSTREVILAKNFEQVKTSDKTDLNKNGVIPNEKVAYEIGKIILEEYAGQAMEYETDEKIYFLEVKYYEKDNCWEIYQSFEYKDGKKWAMGGKIYIPTVVLNKNTGKIVYINTYSSI